MTILSFIIQENAFESVVCEKVAILSRPQCVKIDIAHGRDPALLGATISEDTTMNM